MLLHFFPSDISLSQSQENQSAVLSHFSGVQLFAILWTVAHQAPLSMGFSRQEYWSGLPCPPSGDPPNPGIEPTSLTFAALAVGFFTTSATWETQAVHKRKLLWFLNTIQ